VFYPSWGKARLHGMIANRPDWTLSRQRQWGVPMPFFIRKETGELHPRALELLEEVAKRVEQGGIEAWQSVDVDELLKLVDARTRIVILWIALNYDIGQLRLPVRQDQRRRRRHDSQRLARGPRRRVRRSVRRRCGICRQLSVR
jgi:uncharacterized protein with von Willebrand factor type A (vWA) domain